MASTDWLSDSFADPMAWMSLLGTGANLYTNYQNNQAMNDYNKVIRSISMNNANQANNYNTQAAAYPALWGGMLNSYMGGLAPLIAALSRAANQPLNVNRYFQQLTDAEKMAILRPPMAEMQARGYQPGGYWDSVVAATLAGDTEKRFGTALGGAEAERQSQIQGLEGALRGFPGFPTPPMPINPMLQQMPPSPMMPNAPTSDPFGSYARLAALRSAPKEPTTATPPETSSSDYSSYIDKLIQDALGSDNA